MQRSIGVLLLIVGPARGAVFRDPKGPIRAGVRRGRAVAQSGRLIHFPFAPGRRGLRARLPIEGQLAGALDNQNFPIAVSACDQARETACKR